MLREDKKDLHTYDNTLPVDDFIKRDILTYDFNTEDDIPSYIAGMMHIFCHILIHQAQDGFAVIKVQDMVMKPIIDILYLLTTLYEKVYILKPNNTDMCESERFIICKQFLYYPERIANYLYECKKVEERGFMVTSLLKKELPCIFLNKIEESNIIIGNQQLEYIQQMISLFKSKNKEEKCDLWKKNNIQKCIKWCEKFKIPYNKFTDRVNIFLHMTTDGTREYEITV